MTENHGYWMAGYIVEGSYKGYVGRWNETAKTFGMQEVASQYNVTPIAAHRIADEIAAETGKVVEVVPYWA